MKTNYSFNGKPVILFNSGVYDVNGSRIGCLFTDRNGGYSVFGSNASGSISQMDTSVDVWLGVPTPKAQAEMENYLKVHKVDSYFPAYAARLHNNHFVLMEVAEEVKKQGFECYCSKDRYDCQTTELIYAIRGAECLLFGFKEVPYEWYAYSHRYPGLTAGLVRFNSYDFPFSLKELLSQAGPNRFKEGYFNPSSYQKL